MYYINLFFLYSILGFIFESFFMNLMNTNYDSGILFGPWTPIYGVGVIVIVLIYKWLERHIKREYKRFIFLFFLSAIILSLVEWVGGVLIENVFNKVFWNYEFFKYNIGKYISLETACMWGIISLFIIYLLKKPMDKLIERIPKWSIYTLTGLFIVDILLIIIIK